ncbi:MAG: EAL domain-containing response regulator [Aphanothece sp. CMT-3BRIN-NPC111]|jgi:EAL domain-containing protein (putative c-di-GMP-specific phosphodiesterase class I)/CheY-like chemotaxis protein|nr:EAL domain-containing response regulator [Aphanothece sp. CMT-3BRIN-NPC111]
MKILVIEDEELVRESILELLEAEGFHTIDAASGDVGVELAQRHKPDLIICDVMMPNLDGYGVLNILRQNSATATIPFIFLTAKADKVDFRQGMNLGADDYLTKPYEAVELLEAIATQLRKYTTLSQHYAIQNIAVETKLDTTSDPLALEPSLRHALEREEFQIYYQPQVNLQSGQIVGSEALLRWRHSEKGFISPTEFIPIAEATGLIIPIGEWVLHTACTQTKDWQNRLHTGSEPLRLAVNLSAYQFSNSDLNNTIIKILTETNFSPKSLELELTESLIIQDTNSAIQIMHELKKLGIQLSIDDFGMGYSSLSYLQQLPFDTLKIDRSFVQNVTNNNGNAGITKAIIQMARSLNLNVIAEGVETEAELAFLCQENCDVMQGYLFSRPLPAKEFEQLLIEKKSLVIPSY